MTKYADLEQVALNFLILKHFFPLSTVNESYIHVTGFHHVSLMNLFVIAQEPRT